ncbi:MAG: hypothetical protein RLZZ480_224 [Candidatus Parcubacteria bacterium]|jgi:uncharacterized membrane protein YeaQ/YmgE (transglycosylase-associated protein family)
MGTILWIVFGGLAGWISSLIMNTDSQQGIILNVVVGIIGAIVGGYLMHFVGFGGVTGFDLYSFFVAVAGAVVFLFLFKIIQTGIQ